MKEGYGVRCVSGRRERVRRGLGKRRRRVQLPAGRRQHAGGGCGVRQVSLLLLPFSPFSPLS